MVEYAHKAIKDHIGRFTKLYYQIKNDKIDARYLLDVFDKDDILWYLEGSYDLENHDDDVRKEYHDELYKEIFEEVESTYDFNYKQFIKDIAEEYSPDDYHKLICDILGVGYYDKDRFKERIKLFSDWDCFGYFSTFRLCEFADIIFSNII